MALHPLGWPLTDWEMAMEKYSLGSGKVGILSSFESGRMEILQKSQGKL